MSTPKSKTAEQVLKYAATIAASVAFWGTLWNLLYDRFLYHLIKICAGDIDPGSLSSLNDCKPVSHVSWVLIIVCAVVGAGLAAGYVVVALLPTSRPDSATTARPSSQSSPFEPNPLRPANPPVAGYAPQPSPPRHPFAFLGDARLVGLWTLCGLVLTVIQTFFR
ncbi:hypothetical protein ACQPW1_27590 [Nocardia sp. CA-128927]|uniref:hypothetical protein n=1 Tax=Nocardia sp. CA-128927 TaxID=3239975 RepID=UPI003D998BB6